MNVIAFQTLSKREWPGDLFRFGNLELAAVNAMLDKLEAEKLLAQNGSKLARELFNDQRTAASVSDAYRTIFELETQKR